MSSNCPIVPLEKINSFIVVEAGQIILCPTAKSASTLLKRVACLLQGQTPIWRCSTWESRPALAVHDPLVNGLKTLAHYSSEDQADMLTSSEWLRLAVTRHPAERLVSFWFDKIFLQDPYYQELSSLIRQKPDLLPHSEPPDFDQFLIYLHHHWSLLSQDCHLTPQSSLLCIPSISYNLHLDRDNLCSDLQAILVNRVNSDTLELVNHELMNYKSHYRQELSSLWSKLFTNDLLDLVQNLYHDDLSFFSYDLPVVASNSSFLAPLAIVQGCLADASRQVQERNQQIGFLQAEIRRLHAQVNDPAAWLRLPAIASALPGESPVSQHHTDDHEFAVLYQLLAAGQPNQLLERLSHILKEHSLSGQLLGEIYYLEGVANNLLGNFESALRLFERAQDCGFITPYLLFNGGNSCRSLGHQEDAQRLFSQALELQPDFPECKHNLCLSLYDSRDYQRAEVGFRTLLRDHPSYFQAAFCLGNLLRDLKRYPEAVEAYKLSIEHSPQYVDAWNNLGLAYGDLKRNDLAISAYLQCLSIDAAFPHARQNIAQAYILKKDYQSALGHFELLAALNYGVSQNVLALQGQINCLLELGCYEAALERADLCSEHERVRLMARLHVLPVLYDSTDQLNTIRVRWSQDLKALYGLLTDISSADDDYPALWMHAWSLTNFYLAYQMQDDRELQEIYASCLVLILKQRLAKFMQVKPARLIGDRSPLRIGVISPHLRRHNGSIWALGWLERLAGNSDYQIFSYNVGDQEDDGTHCFARLGTYRHLPINSDDPVSSLNQIETDNLDVLLFTDIGMHARSKVLSVLNLARLQIQGWGHPVTSGSTAINYYLSGADMETTHGDKHYTEILWRLPSTGLVYEKPIAIHDGKCLYEKLQLPVDRPLLLSLQSTFKYSPEYDYVFARIIQNNPDVLILFAGHMGCKVIEDRFLGRLRGCCQQHGVCADDNLRVLPRLDYPDFMGLFSIAHHTLDTIGWNGGNSSFQSFSLNCPVVTLPTQLMRGRHTVSMLKKMDICELIASDVDDYIAISSRLLRDASFYQAIKSRIAESHSLLFGDEAVAIAFEAFIRKHGWAYPPADRIAA